MPQYLTREWMDVANSALAGSPAVAEATKGKRATIQQEIAGGPNGQLVVHLSVDDGRVTINDGPADKPDVRVKTDYQTASQMHSGEVNTITAFMSGQVRAKGNLTKVMALQKAQGVIDDALRSFETEY